MVYVLRLVIGFFEKKNKKKIGDRGYSIFWLCEVCALEQELRQLLGLGPILGLT